MGFHTFSFSDKIMPVAGLSQCELYDGMQKWARRPVGRVGGSERYPFRNGGVEGRVVTRLVAVLQ